MWRLPLFFYERRTAVLAAALVAALLAGLAAAGLRLDVSAEAMIPAGSPERKARDEVRSLFGTHDSAAVFAADAALFTRDRLRLLREVHDLLAALPGVARVDSLFSIPDLRDEGGVLVAAPILAAIPDDPGDLARLRARAVAHPLLARSAISADGTAMLLRVVPAGGVDPDAGRALAREIEAVLATRRAGFATLEAVGSAPFQIALEDALRHDLLLLLPITTSVLYLLLALFLRSPLLAAVPILNGALATVFTLGGMALLGIPVTLLNATLPALILVVGGMEDVHLIIEFRERLREHALDKLAIYETTERIGFAVLLNGLTTMLGFAAVGFGTLPVLRLFGLAATLGMLLRFLVTLAVLPALLGLLAGRIRAAADIPDRGEDRAGRFSAFVVDRLAPRAGLVIACLAAITAAGLLALAGLPRGNDLLGFLGEDDPIARRVRAVETRMAGTETLHLVLRAAPGEFESPEALERLRRLTDRVRGLDGVDVATSLADIVALLHQELRADGTPGRIPGTSSGVAQVLMFADPAALTPYVTADRGAADVLVRTARHDEAGLLALAQGLEAAVPDQAARPWTVQVAGDGLAAARAAASITTSQALSLGGMTATLFVIVAAIFLSVRCAAAAVAVNLVAVAAMFLLMRLTGIPLNVGTCMVASITLGVVIDDTLHLLVRYNREVRVHRDEREGIRAAARGETLPMLATAAALAGGFAVLGFSRFVPVRQFGLLSAGVIAIAVVADLVVSPVLFARTRIVTLWDLLGLSLRRVLLEDAPIFAGLRPWQARRLVLASDLAVHRAGEAIGGGPGSPPAMYVVLDGAVALAGVPGGPVGPGATFGEEALFDAAAPPVAATAVQETRVLVLSRRSLDSLRRFSPFLASRLQANLGALVAARAARGQAASEIAT
ncbi:MAG TPA: MMPL family transporter [Candidatus Polarisedimenticolia bacterium]|nr:MMPL family transporter [Candidatus Polarisedimenticolia bacterium]